MQLKRWTRGRAVDCTGSLIQRGGNSSEGSNPSGSAINISDFVVASNKIYAATKIDANWIIGSPHLRSFWEPSDELKPLKDLIKKTQFISRFRVRRKK